MRVEEFLRDSAAALPDKTALVARRSGADLSRARRGLRPTRRGPSPHAASRAAIASSSSWTMAGRRWSRSSPSSRPAPSSARSILRPRPTSSPSSSTTAGRAALITQQKLARGRRRGGRGRAQRCVTHRRRRPSAALPAGCVAFDAIACASRRRRSPSSRHRRRSGDADLHLGVDRPSQGRDDDAPQYRRGRDVDHHLSREHAPTTSSSTCCRSPSTTASTRC